MQAVKRLFPIWSALLAATFLSGCGGAGSQEKKPADAKSVSAANSGKEADSPQAKIDPPPKLPESKEIQPVPLDKGVAKLLPENSRVEFIGSHNEDNPEPRHGGFELFSGQAEVDVGKKALTSIQFEFQTDSLWTAIGPLTAHLKSADFLDTQQHPTAKFQSTSIEMDSSGNSATVNGTFTLMSVTKDLSIPVALAVGEQDVVLYANFKINRADYGMMKHRDRVVEEVEITVFVGMKTVVDPPQKFP